MNRSLIAVCLGATVATPLSAAPFDPGRVAADAAWVAHVDVERFKASIIGSAVLEDPQRFDIDAGELDEFREATGLDLREDVMSVTLYGTGPDPEADTVIVAVTSAQADAALAKLIAEGEARAMELDGSIVHAVKDAGDALYVHVRDAAVTRRLVAVAHDAETLAGALRVLDGAAPGLNDGAAAGPRARPGPDSIAFVAGDIAAARHVPPASEILKLSEGFSVDVGETGGEAYGLVTVAADTPEKAAYIVEVVQGMIALGHLMSSEEEDLRQLGGLLGALDVEARGNALTVSVRYDALRLLETMDEAMDGHGHGHGHDHDHDHGRGGEG